MRVSRESSPGKSKRLRLLRKVSARLPSASASVRFTVLVVLVAAIFLVFVGPDSTLAWTWAVCMILGAGVQSVGDFMFFRGRWVVGEIARIIGFAVMNLGIIGLILWLWVSSNEAWFWYSILLYGTLLLFLLGWNSRGVGSGGPRVR